MYDSCSCSRLVTDYLQEQTHQWERRGRRRRRKRRRKRRRRKITVSFLLIARIIGWKYVELHFVDFDFIF